MASAKFLEGFSGNLADEWIKTLFTPAFVFWLGGGLAALQHWGWDAAVVEFQKLQEPLPLVLGILVLLTVAASGFVVQQFDFTVLRLLEGYWPGWLNPLAGWLVKGQRRRFKRIDQQLQTLNRQGLATLTPQEREAYIQADLDLGEFPELGRLLPTRLGNILRAAEDHCAAKYGLDAIICWPRLWLLLPEATKTELSQARQQLNGTVRIWVWGMLFLIWAPLFQVWWPLPLGLGTAWLAHRWLIQAARVYGDLIEAAFDLYRLQLYQAVRWPLPSTPAEERVLGQALTDYLWHGSDQGSPTFTTPK
jgi:hypothetical protein